MDNKKMKSAVIAATFVAGAVTALLLNRRARQKTGEWADEIRDELTRRISETKDITQEKYSQIIDDIKTKYAEVKDMSSQELDGLIDELKSHWKTISQEAEKQMEADQKKEKSNRKKTE